MTWYWNALILLTFTALVVCGLTAFQRHLRKPGGRKGTGGSAGLGLVESLFAPSSYEARLELERQGQKMAPAPSPGDPHHGLKVELDADGLPARVTLQDR